MFELFGLQEDPVQLTNLADNRDRAERVDFLRQKLAAGMIRDEDYLPLP